MRVLAGEISRQFMVAFRKGGAVVSCVYQKASLCQPLRIGFDTSDESRSEYDDIHFSQFCAVQNLSRIITEIERHGDGTAL